ERLVQPLVGGIYTGDPNDLSLKATLPQYLAMEREHGSLIRAAWRQQSRDRATRQQVRHASGARYGMFVSLADGMDVLPRTLAAALPPGTVRTHSAVRRLSRNGAASPWLVELLDRPPVEADAVIVNVAYRRDQVQHPLDGFGVVVPATEGRSILAVSFSSVKFPSRAPSGTV